MQSLIHEGQLYRDCHQRYCLETREALVQKIFTCTSGCPLELWLNSSWIAGHVEGDGENYWFFADNGGKVVLTEQMTVRYVEHVYDNLQTTLLLRLTLPRNPKSFSNC